MDLIKRILNILKVNSDKKNKKIVFISHIHEDAEYAKSLKKILLKYYNEHIDVFVSTNNISLQSGRSFLRQIFYTLNRADCLISIYTEASVNRAWPNFESGFFASKYYYRDDNKLENSDPPIFPLCVGGLEIKNLPSCINFIHAIKLSDIVDLNKLNRDICSLLCVEYKEFKNDEIEEYKNIFEQTDNRLANKFFKIDIVTRSNMQSLKICILNLINKNDLSFFKSLNESNFFIILGEDYGSNDDGRIISSIDHFFEFYEKLCDNCKVSLLLHCNDSIYCCLIKFLVYETEIVNK